MLDLLVDCGVLCLPALPGVLWVLAKVAIKSLFTPLYLDVLLQAWQVAIDTNVAISDSDRYLLPSVGELGFSEPALSSVFLFVFTAPLEKCLLKEPASPAL